MACDFAGSAVRPMAVAAAIIECVRPGWSLVPSRSSDLTRRALAVLGPLGRSGLVWSGGVDVVVGVVDGFGGVHCCPGADAVVECFGVVRVMEVIECSS